MVERIVVKWQGKELAIPVSEDDTVQSLKRKIQDETNVQPQRQKLLGLKRRAGGMPGDDDPVSGLLLKDGQKIMMMGCASVDAWHSLTRAARGSGDPPRAAPPRLTHDKQHSHASPGQSIECEWLMRKFETTVLLIVTLLYLPLPIHGWGPGSVAGNGPYAVYTPV